MKLNSQYLAVILICLSIGIATSAFAQSDGLDKNSFDPPASTSEDINEEDSDEISDDSEDEKSPSEEDSEDYPDDSTPTEGIMEGAPPLPSDQGLNSFDNGVLPQDQNPKSLSNQIRDLNPDSMTGEQDYFPSFIYDERGRSDPFEPKLKNAEPVYQGDDEVVLTEEQIVRAGLMKYELSALTLTAILISTKTKAKALIKDPTGTVYVIHENDSVGRNNGVIKKIRQGQVVVLEYRDQPEGGRLYTTQILSLGK